MAAPKPQYIDLRGHLPYNQANANRWLVKRALQGVQDLLVHYTAEHIDQNSTQEQEIAHIAGDANYHIQKDWNPPNGVHGWAIMYHYAIGPSGAIYQLNDDEDVTWNCTNGNYVALATVLLLGDGQDATPAQLATLKAHLDYLLERTDIRATRARVYGHGECGGIWGGGPPFGNSTQCPSEHVKNWVVNYRTSVPTPPPVPNAYSDPVTHHDVHDAFYTYFMAAGSVDAAIARYGRPITDEMQEVLGDGKPYTVQYFERARFEWHTEVTPGQVMLGLLGTEALAAKSGKAACACETH